MKTDTHERKKGTYERIKERQLAGKNGRKKKRHKRRFF